MDDSCAVCAETLEWVAYGACGHKDVCSTCVACLRFICNDRRCCICKTEATVVFVTKSKFCLDMMRNKSLTFVGDSVGRNQMQSLMCLLSQHWPEVRLYCKGHSLTRLILNTFHSKMLKGILLRLVLILLDQLDWLL